MSNLPLIIVHGGAGEWKDEKIPIGIKYVEKAASIGFETLLKTGSVLDAAEVCTAFMESCGKLNAGVGATKNSDGERELDAMIVDGKTLSFGSVAAIRGIQNPISLARYVMEKTDYTFFAGENANRLYKAMIEEEYRKETKNEGIDLVSIGPGGDTVGCIVVDSDGNISTTSSTGGIRKKIPGRVGDSPVFGAGAYANEVCGASATGYGEHIMRVMLSRMAVLYVEEGESPQAAADKGMDLFLRKTGSEAGLIVADSKGNIGKSTNAKAMPTTIIRGNLEILESFVR
ncbi:MAG: isoaspartyl peptidase/L-asparaginase family protein [Candidatus Hodarchaeota archaeon]